MHKLIKIPVSILYAFLLSGCATVDEKLASGIPIHGNFCGPYIPFIPPMPKQLIIERLESIDPIDKIDAACKKHDICYMEKGYFDRSCDKGLILDIKRLGKNYENARCFGLTSAMLAYFSAANPDLTSQYFGETAIFHIENIGAVALTGIREYLLLSAKIALMPIAPLYGRSPFSVFEEKHNQNRVDHNSQDIKDYRTVVYPSRYEVCN